MLGSKRSLLTIQFLLEAQLVCLLAIAGALALVASILPGLNEWLGSSLAIPFDSVWFVLTLLVASLVVGLLAGLYPAIYLSSFTPSRVLKGKVRTAMKSGKLRSGLVITQLAITVVLTTTTGFIYQQMKYIQNKKLGFDAEQVVVIDRSAVNAAQADVFRNEISRLPGVQSVSSTDYLPQPLMNSAGTFRMLDAPEDQLEVIWRVRANEEIVRTLDMRMISEIPQAQDVYRESPGVILNQTAAAMFDWDQPVGERLATGQTDEVYEVVGLLEDFHFESLHQKVKPMVIMLENTSDLRYMAVRLDPGDIPLALESIESTWKSFYPEETLSLTFLDEQLDALYRSEQKEGQLLAGFAGLAILVACLGLFGLAAYMTEQRVKEIGVRKVMGASAMQIVTLFSQQFLIRTGIAFLVALPVSIFLILQWLERFAYQSDINMGIFVLSGLIVLIVVLSTISYHSIRAAFANPIESLRYE